ncbi:MAG TPA: TraB/GumN family protein [Candidatus Deferrimicrobiaceae bacterium]|nr:TraB/GumN family protein [Candidatus Deferrimicrobiaceae bacterium]
MNRPPRRKALLRVFGLAVLCFASPLFAQQGPRPEKRTFLWEVRSESAVVHLLGSIHLLKPDLYPLDEKIEEAFARSDVLVVETNVRNGAGEERQRKMLQGAIYPGNDTIVNHISKETYELLKNRFPGPSLERVGRFRPWALAMTIAVMEYQKMGLDYHSGIDIYFLDQAANGKPIREIESPDAVIGLLNGFSDEYQDLFLQYTLLDLDQVREKTDRILAAWSDGDSTTMEEILSESVREHPRLMPVFEALFYRRNAAMAAKVEEYLKEKGRFFVVVGAGHLVGEKGIVERLKGKGFSVEQQ